MKPSLDDGNLVLRDASDNDGISDGDEIMVYGTDPMNPDTDGDGFDDREEIYLGTDPLNGEDYPVDTDGDGLYDHQEAEEGTNRADPDTDDDGISDYDEVRTGRDPLTPNSGPYRLTASYFWKPQEAVLEWRNDSLFGGNEIHVERSTNGVNWMQVANLSAGQRFFRDNPPISCGDYQYRVRAFRTSDGIYSDGSGMSANDNNVDGVACVPANSQTQFLVVLDHLYANSTTELGDDEPYFGITELGAPFGIPVGLDPMGNGDGQNLSISMFFEHTVYINLMESDSSSRDDDLGTLTIDFSDAPWGQGLQGHSFINGGADYNLTYRVIRTSF